jgi:selenocysteine lyase/cysteine desulfurase
VAPDTRDGEVDVDALNTMVQDKDTALITLNHMPTNGGLVNPAVAVGEVAARHGVPYLLDACQTVGQIPIDVAEIGCDMLTGTSRKYLRGPRGVGFLYVREAFTERLDPVFVEIENAPIVLQDSFTLAGGAHRFETWEKSYANVAGFGAAVDYAMDIGIAAMWDRIQMLASTLRSQLSMIDGVTVHDRGSIKGGIVTFDVDSRQTLEVRELLAEGSINVSTSTPFSAPYDMRSRGIEGLVRASVHAYNTDDEIDDLVSAIQILA